MNIKLSNSTLVFDYLGNSYNQFPEYQTLIIPANSYNFSDIEKAFTGNDLITVGDDEQIIITLRGYINIRSITKDNSYISGYDNEGNPILLGVYIVSLEKEDINNKVKYLEIHTDTNTNDITDIQVALAEIYESMPVQESS